MEIKYQISKEEILDILHNASLPTPYIKKGYRIIIVLGIIISSVSLMSIILSGRFQMILSVPFFLVLLGLINALISQSSKKIQFKMLCKTFSTQFKNKGDVIDYTLYLKDEGIGILLDKRETNWSKRIINRIIKNDNSIIIQDIIGRVLIIPKSEIDLAEYEELEKYLCKHYAKVYENHTSYQDMY